jgi:membrane-associated phospholipid phosphatase
MSSFSTAPGHGSHEPARSLADADRPARPTQLPTRMRVIRETLVVLLGALLYFFVRGLVETRVSLAMSNGDSVVSLEREIGLYHEPWLQSLIVGSDWMVTWANRIYIFGHWPVIVLTLIWLVWRHTEQFAVYRTALLISGAIGLVFFVLLPTAPPRLLTDQGFVDTVTQHSHAYRVLQPPAFTNQYAAMPSLHVGWNLLMGIAIVRHAGSRWAKIFGVVMPLVMFLATVMTANHYLLDGIVGSMVALAGLAIALMISRPSASSGEREPELPSRVLGQGWNQRQAA